jgi:hypothetical protein
MVILPIEGGVKNHSNYGIIYQAEALAVSTLLSSVDRLGRHQIAGWHWISIREVT